MAAPARDNRNTTPQANVAWVFAALAIIAADAAAIAFSEGDGPLRPLLFGSGLVAGGYLLSALMGIGLDQVAAFWQRPRGAPPLLVPAWGIAALAAGLVVAAAGANTFESTDDGLRGALSFVSSLGMIAIAASLAALLLATCVIWLIGYDE